MTTVVNLNKHRKAKAVSGSKAKAVENRIRFGRTKVKKTFDETRLASCIRLDETGVAEVEQD